MLAFMQSPPPLNRNRARSISDGSIQSHSSMGDTSRASGVKDARGRSRRPEDTRSGWLSQASGTSEEPEEKVLSPSAFPTVGAGLVLPIFVNFQAFTVPRMYTFSCEQLVIHLDQVVELCGL